MVIKRYHIGLLCLLAIFWVVMSTTTSFSEQELFEMPQQQLSRELIEQMIADEGIPEEIRRELEDMLKKGEFESPKGEPIEIYTDEGAYPPPAEIDRGAYPPPVETDERAYPPSAEAEEEYPEVIAAQMGFRSISKASIL
jgi:hypothetical protein